MNRGSGNSGTSKKIKNLIFVIRVQEKEKEGGRVFKEIMNETSEIW